MASPRDAVAVDPPEQVFAPGTVPACSNYGNALAGCILERTTGQPFAEAAETSILDRAGMDSSSFEQQLGTPAEGRRMSLGLFDETRGGHPALGHGGDTQVFRTEMRLYPRDDAGIFVALNGSGRDALDSHELRAAPAEGFADRCIASAEPAADEPAAGDGADGAPADPADPAGVAWFALAFHLMAPSVSR